MPELPDVEYFKRYLDATALHRRIESVAVRDRRVLEGVSPRRLRQRLRGRRFEASRRHGKQLALRLDEGGWLGLHFGMTGEPKVFADDDEEPQHAQVLIDFAKGRRLAWVSQRRIGRVRLIDDFEGFVQRENLGPDALALDLPSFRELLSGRRGSVKSALMNQAVIAGIGNVYSDEILFQAKLHPGTSVERLDDAALRRLFRAMRKVLETAADRKADPARMPRTWLLPHRESGATCPRCGSTIRAGRRSGRGFRFCPGCQPGK